MNPEFRALAIVNDKHAGIKAGDFVHGCYIESGCDSPCIVFGDGEQIEVSKKTLGQYAGAQTKDKEKVFEDDVLKSYYGKNIATGDVIYCYHRVFWNDVSFNWSVITLKGESLTSGFDGTTTLSTYIRVNPDFEISGNIHQGAGK